LQFDIARNGTAELCHDVGPHDRPIVAQHHYDYDPRASKHAAATHHHVNRNRKCGTFGSG